MPKISPRPSFSNKPINRMEYDNFISLDISKPANSIGKNYLSNMLNMVSTTNGILEKRLGTRTLYTIDKPINGLFEGIINGKQEFIAHGGTKLYKLDGLKATVIYSNINNAKSSYFFSDIKGITNLFIMTGKEYLKYDGNVVTNVEDDATIPTLFIDNKPDNTSPRRLQYVNLLQSKRNYEYVTDGTSTTYQLPEKGFDSTLATIIQKTATVDKIYTEITDFTFDRVNGKIVFKTAPSKGYIEGKNSLIITASITDNEAKNKIKNCTINVRYGLGGENGGNSIFITGNPNEKNIDRWSYINDPTYFPDINFAINGNENTAIKAYFRFGESLVIGKEDDDQDYTFFTRNVSLIDNKALYQVRSRSSGIGVISSYSGDSLIDEPLFLSREGIYAITTPTIRSERSLQNRSELINNKLLKEPNLDKAVSIVWRGLYILSVNSHCYVLDGKKKVYSTISEFGYACYYWENINANCFAIINDELWFGCLDGTIKKFNTDMEDRADKYNDDDQAVVANFETLVTDDGNSSRYKTAGKKGWSLLLQPYTRTGVDVYYSVDGEPYELLITKKITLFSWTFLDFRDFSFFTSITPKLVIPRFKIKRYQTIQFKFENKNPSQGFGLYSFSKEFVIDNYIR